MDDKEKNFLDPRTLLAVGLVAVVWFGWQSYLSKKYPDLGKTPAPVVASGEAAAAGALKPATAEPNLGAATIAAKAVVPETHFAVDSAEAGFQLSSQGMAIQALQLKKFTHRDQKPIQFAPESKSGLFEVGVLGQSAPLVFQIEKKTETEFVGHAQVGATLLEQKITYDPKNYAFNHEIALDHVDPSFPGLTVRVPETRQVTKSSGFMMGSYEHQEFYVNHAGDKSERLNLTKDKVDQNFADVSIASVGSQYFATAVLDKSEVVPSVQLQSDPGTADLSMLLQYKLANSRSQVHLHFKTFAGPKAHDVLLQVDPELPAILDFGYFSAIGKVLLTVLKSFNGFFGNWGVSIIFLTLVVRLLVLPVNIASYKSMKRMQKIQPMMQSLRERHKEDPATLQRETMALMKREKVNPVGGCLPMLLQMPIFFALFSVLGHSIELYQAPFFGWISDLSLKDPFFILPALVGIIFFIQQKITPTTMDPAQAKVMQFMPLLFSFMMIGLPSGLNLYTFVSTLFGVAQQRFFMRDRHAAGVVSIAKT